MLGKALGAVAALQQEGPLKAAAEEPEGWAATAAFEAFLQSDPDPAARDRWMERYEAWAKIATVDGIKERIIPVRAEHLARKGDFAGAYRELGLDQPQPAALSEPSVLILDEARAGRIAETLPRIERLVESDSRDDLRLEVLEIAIARAPAAADAVVAQIKDRYSRRMAQALQAGARGDTAIARSIDEWARGARANQTAPFDDPETARRDSWDMVLRGAIAANNLEAFTKALAARPAFNTPADAESASRVLRVLMREGRADWIRVFGPALKLPEGESVSVDEDIGPMRNLPVDKLVAVAEAGEAAGRFRGAIVDTAIEMLVARGAVTEARDLFARLGRIEELNRVTFDQERILKMTKMAPHLAVALGRPDARRVDAERLVIGARHVERQAVLVDREGREFRVHGRAAGVPGLLQRAALSRHAGDGLVKVDRKAV
jgi:hypothetical protein